MSNWYDLPFSRWNQDPAVSAEREFQRQPAYDAENSLADIKSATTFESIDEIQAYVNKLTSSAWFQRRWPRITPKSVRVSTPKIDRKNSWAYGSRFHIVIPKWAYGRLVILHELAHSITPDSAGSPHGRYWARCFLELVQHEMGEDTYAQLRDAFKAHGVKYKPKRRLNPEAKKAASARMAAFRRKIEESAEGKPRIFIKEKILARFCDGCNDNWHAKRSAKLYRRGLKFEVEITCPHCGHVWTGQYRSKEWNDAS